MIRANHLAWSENEHDEIINDALKQYMQTRRKLKIDSGCSEPPKKLSACTSYSAADSAVSNIENATPGFDTGNTDTCSTDTSDSDESSDEECFSNSDIDVAESNIMHGAAVSCEQSCESDSIDSNSNCELSDMNQSSEWE